MEIGVVIGPAAANVKHPTLKGLKLVLVRRERVGGAEPASVAWDRVDAGPGDRVLLMAEGGSANRLLGRGPAPVRTVIIGYIDRVDDGRPRNDD